MSTPIRALLILILVFNTCSSRKENDVIPRIDSDFAFSLQNVTIVKGDSAVVHNKKVLLPNSLTIIQVLDIPDHVSFIVVQAHSFMYSVSLSYRQTLEPKFYINGTNIGLVYDLTTSHTATLFIQNPNTFNVSTMIAISPYTKEAPIPGGCNLEFPTYTAPYLSLKYSSEIITIDGQPGMAPEDVKLNSCDLNDLKYRMYQLYLTERDFSEESYFNGIIAMLTPQNAHNVSQMVRDSVTGPLLRHVFAAYRGTGTVYTLVLESNDGSVAAYVPAHTFACNNGFNFDSCEILSTTLSKVVCAVIMFIGLFLCYVGHIYFGIELLIMATLQVGVFAYMGLNTLYHSTGGFIIESTVIGIVGGFLWLFLSWCIGNPMIPLIVPIFNLGVFLACIVFFVGVGDIPIFESDLNYWLTLLASGCVFVIIFMIAPKYFNIIGCSIIGGYASILPVDYYAGTNLKYILLNMIYRQTVDDFGIARTAPPFQTPDIILAVFWGCLSISGLVYQIWLSSERPPFPPPYMPCSSVSCEGPDLRTPLLSDARFSFYSPGSDNVFHA